MAASDFFDLRSLLTDIFVFEISWLTILLGISSAYILYYYVIVVDKPKVFAHKESEILSSIEKHCPILFESYWPTFWGFHAHITSIFRARFQGYLSIEYKREVLLLCDGGEVALDWAEPSQDCQDSPVLLVLPGLTGGTDNNYIGHMVADGIELKFRAVVFNQRGNGGIRLKTPKTFCASDTSDLREVILHIRKQCPSSHLMAVGVSLGGMLLTKYLHDCGPDSHLNGVVTFSTPWDPPATRKAMVTFPNKYLYNYFFAWKMRRMVLRHASDFEGRSDVAYDMKSLHKVKTIEEFDEQVTIKVFNYSSVDEYYRDCSNKQRIPNIKTPIISFNAVDDPFVPESTLPVTEFQTNPLTALVLTKRGGHFGFLEGLLPTGGTWMNRALRQCLTALHHHNLHGAQLD